MQLQHTFLPLASLVRNEGQIKGLPTNPRQWTKTEINRLKKSIKETPELLEARGLIVYPHKNQYVILGGNMRYSALKELGVEQAPCVLLPEELPLAKLKEIVIKDNGSFGEWDFDLLGNEWDDLPLSDWGVPAWESEQKEEEPEAQEDDFDETTAEIPAKVCRGDIWQLGNHRLMCGDSTSAKDVAELMGGNKADLLITDPPYNVAYEGKTEDKMKIMNDKLEDAQFRMFLKDAFAACDENMKPGASFYIWHADSEGFNFRGACRDVDWAVRECLVWNKNSMVMGRQDYQWKHEPCLYGWNGGASHNWYSDRSQTTVLDFDRPTRNGEHPTMKLIPLFAYLMKNSSKKGDIVLDVFGGSGTTMMAAEQLERSAYLMELDPHYCDVIIARWETATNNQAVKIQ